MRYAITKMFRVTNRHGDLGGATVIFHSKDGRTKKMIGKIGGPDFFGRYEFDLPPGFEIAKIEKDADVVLALE